MSASEVGTLILDASLRIKQFIPASRDDFGLSKNDEGRPIGEVGHHLGYADLDRDARWVLREGAVVERELQRDDRWYRLRLSPKRPEEAQTEGVTVSVTDITKHKSSERALQDAEKWLRLATETGEIGVWQFDFQSREFSVHCRRYDQIFGYEEPVEEWSLARFLDHVHPDDRAAVKEKFEDESDSGTWDFEGRIIRADGEERWIAIRGEFQRGVMDGSGRAVGVVQDITERRKREQHLERQQEQLERQKLALEAELDEVFGRISDAVYALDDEWRFTYVNDRAQELLERSAEQLLGQNIWEAFPKAVETAVYDTLQDAMGTGETQGGVFYYEPFGMWVEQTVYPSETGVSVYFRDVTERKRHERNLSFLADVKDDLARLTEEDEIIQAVGEKLGSHANVDLVYIVEIDEQAEAAHTVCVWQTEDAPTVPDVAQISDFLDEEVYREAQAGQAVVIDDTDADPQADAEAYRELGMRSIVAVPSHQRGELVHALCIASGEPREWQDDEIETFEEIADRLFLRVQRARTEQALRESERRLRLATNTSEVGVWEFDLEAEELVYQSPQFYEILGVDASLDDGQVLRGLHRILLKNWEQVDAETGMGIEAGEWEHESQIVTLGGETKWIVTHGETYGEAGEGTARAIGTVRDVTERKRRERNAAFIAELADDVSRQSSAGEIMSVVGEKLGEFLDLARCHFVDIDEVAGTGVVTHEWHTEGLEGLGGDEVYEMEDFISPDVYEAAHEGETVVVDDVRTDPRVDADASEALDVRASITVPVVQEGKWTFSMSVADTTPRQWRTDEVELIEDLASRIWLRITRARVESALRESEEEFRALVDASSEVLYRMSPDWSELRERRGGESFEDVVEPRTDWLEHHLHPDDREQVWEAIQEAIDSKTPLDFEHRVYLTDGSLGWIHSRAVPLLDDDGEIKEWLGSASDITERKQAQHRLKELNETLEERVEARTQELRRQQEEFRALVDASASIVWWTGAEGRVQGDSSSWRAFTGQTTEEWKGWGWLDAVHPEDRSQVETRWSQAVEEETILEQEFRLYHAETGTYRWTQVRAVPLYDEDGTIRGWIGMNVDIDRRKRTQDQLVALAAELEERVERRTKQVRELSSKLTRAEQRERQRLAQILHDDLQQRLYGIQMRLEFLREHAEKSDEESLLQQVRRAEEWMEEAIATTKQLSVDLSPPVLKSEGLPEALEWLQSHMGELHDLDVELVVDRNEDFALGEDIRVLLLQVVRELLFNVVKHAGVQEATVTLTGSPDEFVLVVADQGTGFDPDRVETDDEAGFGLTSVRERIALFGGEATIEAEPGAGTRVTVRVPLNE